MDVKQLDIKAKFKNIFKYIKTEWVEFALYVFLLSLPFIDVTTSILRRYNENIISSGQIIKFLAMGIITIYLLFFSKSKDKKKKRNYIAIGILAVFAVLFLVVRYLETGFKIFTEINFLIKFLYLPIMFLGLLDLYENKKIYRKTIINIIIINTLIIASIIFIAILTNTAFSSYELANQGAVGWFYAANEISIIALIGVYFIFAKIFETKSKYKKIIWTLVYFSVFIIFMNLGTKVAIYGMIIHLPIAAFIKIFSKNWRELLIICLMFLASILIVKYKDGIVTDQFKEIIEQKEEVKVLEPFESKILNKVNILLSNRLIFADKAVRAYGESNMMEKMFGMGHEGINGKEFKCVEMDMITLLIRFGIVGFSIYFVIALYWCKETVSALKKEHDTYLTAAIIACIVSLGLGALIGHLYLAPGANIYLILSALVIFTYDEKVRSNKKVKLK